MKSLKIGWPRVVVVAIGLMVATLAYAYAQSASRTAVASTAREAAPSSRLEVEAEVVRSSLPGKIKAALGDAFAGVWFDASTAQLHVGVTSPAARQTAEAVAEQAGLAGSVTETPARSTWGQLVAAQERWSNRLADLFARAEVATALRPQFNSLEVELGSAVSYSERVALEEEASFDAVKVSVVSVAHPHIRLTRDARCKAFAASKAHCDPTIVAGVTIQSASKVCTAGPAVMLLDHMQPTETYILTAGHCIDKNYGGDGVGASWYAYPKAATKESEKQEIGKAIEFINGEKADVGLIKVDNPGYWAKKGFIPVNPAIVLWSGAESDPIVATTEQEPTVGLESCMSAQVTGTSCGEILKLNVEVLGTKGLVEVGAARAEGDSGAPWYSKSYAESSAGVVEGTHVGSKGGNAAFEPLATTFKELTTKLQLLTENTQVRHAFKFEAESVPVTLTGKQHNGKVSIKTTAGTLQCNEVTYTGSQTEKEKVEFELTPSYTGCTSAGLASTIDMNECKYRFTVTKVESFTKREGSMDIVCPAGKEITITVAAGEVKKCTIHVPPLSNLRTVTYTNVGAGATREITIDVNIAKFAYVHTAGTGIGACTTGAGENGTMETSISVTAEKAGGEHVGFFSP